MQYKKTGRKVQVHAYRGYDKEKRRAIVKMLGSYDAYTYELSDGLLDNLTAEEREELQSHIEAERQETEKRNRQYSAQWIDRRMCDAADSIEAGEYELTEAQVIAIWSAMDRLAKVMRKKGHPRPKKQPVLVC